MGELIRIPEFTIGVDEVGLGALAGPITVCAFAAPRGWRGLKGLDDSKALSDAERKRLRSKLWYLIVQKQTFCRIENHYQDEIDHLGVGVVHRRAIESVVRSLISRLDCALITDVIIDGNLNFRGLHPKVRSVVKADTKFNTVRAASILAKVHRDDQMPAMDPEGIYRFASNMGYPTKEHKAALTRHGPSEFHRYSYEPVRLAAKR